MVESISIKILFGNGGEVMAVLYIKEQGSTIQKRGERVVITKGNTSLLEIPVVNVENIAVIGNVQITTQALHMLMENGIDVSYFTFSGKYLGQTGSDRSKNIFLRFAQFNLYNQIDKRLDIAKSIISNKISNQITMIRRHRWKGEPHDWKDDIAQLEYLRETLSQKETSNEIMGVEGMCSNIYFGAFGYMFHCDFEFHGRNRRPPKDPINVLISLGYTFLTREVSSALDAASFEMYLGLLHGIRYGRKSLSLDIVEEFRQPIVDRFVIFACNKRMINRFDFNDDDEGIKLNEEGFKKFCLAFERWMTGAGGVNYRNLIKRQVALLKQAILKQEPYIPYHFEIDTEMEEDGYVSGEL